MNDVDDSLLEAPCMFCGYSGPGYWQWESHFAGCPWRRIGGIYDRRTALPFILEYRDLLVRQQQANAERAARADKFMDTEELRAYRTALAARLARLANQADKIGVPERRGNIKISVSKGELREIVVALENSSSRIDVIEECLNACKWVWSHAGWSYEETIARIRALKSVVAGKE